VLDLEGIVRSWNGAAEAMFGWTAGDMVGQPYPLLQPAQVKNFPALCDQALAEGSVRIAECRRVRKDSEQGTRPSSRLLWVKRGERLPRS